MTDVTRHRHNILQKFPTIAAFFKVLSLFSSKGRLPPESESKPGQLECAHPYRVNGTPHVRFVSSAGTIPITLRPSR
jgi:hypothetical protein